MFRLRAALTGVLLLAPQQGDEPTIADELTALIARTNALEGFHLVYDIESEIEGEAQSTTMELFYRAPDLARMRATSEGATLDFWVEGTDLFMHQGGSWKSASLASLPCMQVLDESFPVEHASGGGVAAFLTLRRGASEKVEFHMSMGYYASGQPTLLGWLENFQRWSGVQRDGKWLSWEEDGIRCRVSRESGFLDEIEATSKKGHLLLRLREAETAAPGSELVTIPEEARSAPEDEALLHTLVPGARITAFHRAAEWLELGGHTWDELASNRWRTVMEALHRRELVVGYTKWLAGIQEQVAKSADGARADLEKDDSAENRAEVERHTSEARTALEENLERGKTRYLGSLQELEAEGKEHPELADIEREVVEALWSELLREPVLAAFDEKFGELLGR